MQYKTISLHLLEQRPEAQERLRRQRMLLPTVELLATQLKTSHEAWKEALSQSSPDQDAGRIASEALELALADLEGYLQTAFPPDETETLEENEGSSLDQAIAFLRRHTPPA